MNAHTVKCCDTMYSNKDNDRYSSDRANEIVKDGGKSCKDKNTQKIIKINQLLLYHVFYVLRVASNVQIRLLGTVNC